MGWSAERRESMVMGLNAFAMGIWYEGVVVDAMVR